MAPHTVLFPQVNDGRIETWTRLAPYLSERRWELLEEDAGTHGAFHGSASRQHPRRRSFQAGPGGLLKLALSTGAVRLILGAPDATVAETFVSELLRYIQLFARSPELVRLHLEHGRPGWRMDPARTLGLAHAADSWTALCVHFSAPPFGLLLATHAYLWLQEGYHTSFVRLHAEDEPNCIFCGHVVSRELPTSNTSRAIMVRDELLLDGRAGIFLQAG